MKSIFSLTGRTALITGASSGLGWHFAKVLATAGAAIVATARRQDRITALIAEIAEIGGTACAIAMDVTDPASVADTFDAAQKQGFYPDIVVNNAGITISKSLLKQTTADWDTVISTNLKGNWLVATEAARRWVDANRPGVIVNIASIVGARVTGGAAPYVISKAGVIQATKTMALELARHEIRVNALLPGYIVTDLNRDFIVSEAGEKLRLRIPSRKFCQLDDLDGPLLLLASDAGRAISGACLAVDRGHLVSGL